MYTQLQATHCIAALFLLFYHVLSTIGCVVSVNSKADVAAICISCVGFAISVYRIKTTYGVTHREIAPVTISSLISSWATTVGIFVF